MTPPKQTRKQQILEALATMLQESPGSRITTAALARQVGVSEAALYRHFPSKSKMFEGLIEFIEHTLFTQISVIISNESRPFDRCEKILFLLLAFCERNPGITRLLTGDALTGETERLRDRIAQLYNRMETELRKILRDSELRENIRYALSVNATANILLSVAEGRISQFVRSDFKSVPTESWQQIWPHLVSGLIEE